MRRNIFFSLLAFLAVLLAGAMVIHPQSTFQGAIQGLRTWAFILVPSLLPFFIISDILVELGVVRLLGILLEPLMRPLFKQPGESGFVVAMGFTSGFPMGAVLTNTLYEKNIVTNEEAGRLLAFTNNSSPLFLLVAIPIGMFNNPHLGIILLLAHYGANLLLGIILGFMGKKHNTLQTKQLFQFKKSLRDFFIFQKKSIPSIGKLLGSAVHKSIQNILTVGGFVVFFAVLIQILQETSLFNIITMIFSKFLLFLGINPNLSEALSIGFFEMTLGVQKASQTYSSLNQQLMITSLILGWSGLSIQAQVTSIVARNNIPIIYYLGGRFFQGILAFLLTFIIFEPLILSSPAGNFKIFDQETFTLVNFYSFTFLASLSILTILLILSLLLQLTLQISKHWKKRLIEK